MHKFHCLKSLQIVKYVKQSLLDGHIPSSVLEKLKRSKEEVKGLPNQGQNQRSVAMQLQCIIR